MKPVKLLLNAIITPFIIYSLISFIACSGGIMGKGKDSPITNNLEEDTSDKYAPEIPDNGLITVSGITANTLILNWQAANDTKTAQLNLAYAVYRSTDGSDKTVDEWESETLVQDYTTGLLQQRVERLSPNSTYYFIVIVKDMAGNKALYTMKDSTTTEYIDTTVPVPGGDGIITASSVTANSLVLSWTEGSDDTTLPGGLEYAVYQSATGNIGTVEECESNGTLIQNYTPALTTRNMTGLLPETEYYFIVVVKDSAGNRSAYKLTVQTTAEEVDSTPPVPGNGKPLSTNIVSSDSIVLLWEAASDNKTASKDLQYAVYESLSGNLGTVSDCESKGTLIQEFSTGLTGLWVKGLLVEKTYYFNVVVKDSAGNSAVYVMTQQTTGTNYVKLGFHTRNSILHGKEIFDAVINKYKIIVNSHETGFFLKAVNTNLLNNASAPALPDYNMFNYEMLSAYGDIDIIIQYDDGTTKSLPGTEVLGNNGACYYSRININGKKIVNLLIKQDDAKKIKERILGQITEKLLNCSKYTGFRFTQDLHRISSYTSAIDTMQRISSTLITINQTAGYLNLALDSLQMTVVTGPTQNDPQDQAINERLGHIIDLLDGIYTNIESIENRLYEIQNTIVSKAGKQQQLNITTLFSTIKAKINALKIAQSISSRKGAAIQFADTIDYYLLNYTAPSEGDWVNFKDYKTNVEKTDTAYLPLQMRIDIPHRRFYTNGTTARIECILTSFTMTNPSVYLPFSFEGLEYLKKLYTARFGINSIIETDEKELNKANSAAAAIYLNDSVSYIGKLRADILNSYTLLFNDAISTYLWINWPDKICEINPNIFWGLDYYLSRSGPCTVKDNLIFLKNFLSQNRGGVDMDFLYNVSSVCNQPALTNGSLYDGPNGLYGGCDKFNFVPYFSFTPFSLHPATAGVYNYWTFNDFPYPPAVLFGGGWVPDKIDINRSTTDITFLDNAVDLINIYYYGNTGRLLEFAASLAALEIQIALYLDPDSQAYRDYITAQ